MSPPKQSTTGTKTDPTGRDWVIHDRLIRLREWGTDRVYELPESQTELVVGSSDECDVRLTNSSRSVSRKHAKLVLADGAWTIIDLKSKNGLRVDGAARERATLDAGAEIGVGAITLVAETARSVALRSFLSRILGWTSASIETVDLALRAVRMAATRRAPLVLSGEADLVPTALALHRIALGVDRPFVAADPRRKEGAESVRSVASYRTAMAALEAAQGGSVCVLAARLPRDVDQLRDALTRPNARAQLIICSSARPTRSAFAAVPIVIPSLDSRTAELSRIIEEYAFDAVSELGAPSNTFRAIDRQWVVDHAADTLAEIEKATMRLVALRINGYNVTRAATQLGMAHVSLSRWIGRRRLPPQ